MKKLEDFYRDEEKVIDACMEEINKHPHVVEKDNVGLVSLKTCILNNQVRLKNQGLEKHLDNKNMIM